MKKMFVVAIMLLILNTLLIDTFSKLSTIYHREFTLSAFDQEQEEVEQPPDPDPDPVIPIEKDGYETSFLIIPDSIDINDPNEFFITSISKDNNGNEDIITESVLEEEATDQDTNKILLSDDIASSAPDGFKVVGIRVPVDDDETAKFSAGYKFQEVGIVDEYVFLIDENPDEDRAKDLTKSNPFDVIDPNYYNYESYIGMDASSNARYFMIPVRDTTKNFDMEFHSSIVPFIIDDEGNVIPQADFKLTVSILGVEFYAGEGNDKSFYEVNSYVKVENSEGENLITKQLTGLNGNDLNYNSNSQYNNENPYPKEINISGQFPKGSKITMGARDEYYDGNGYSGIRWTGAGENEENDYARVYRNGEIVSDIKGAQDQRDYVYFLNGLIDENKKVNIGPSDSIVLFDFNGEGSSGFDLQDTVTLVSLTPVDSGPIYRITMVRDEAILVSGDANMTSETSNSNKTRSSDIEIKVIDTGGSGVEFEIVNIEE